MKVTTDTVTDLAALDTKEEAEAKRLTFKHPEKHGLLCLWQSETKQLWTVVPLPVLDGGWSAVCVANKDNLPAPQPDYKALYERLRDQNAELDKKLAEYESREGPVECEPQPAVTEDGYCDWVCPNPESYLMQCCDCGLIHEVQTRVAKYEPRPSEAYEVLADPDTQAQWRMRRRDDLSPKREEQEPVACIIDGDLYFHHEIDWDDLVYQGHGVELLYTAPQPAIVTRAEEAFAAAQERGWVGLKDESTIQPVPAKGGLLPEPFGIRGGLAHDQEKNHE